MSKIPPHAKKVFQGIIYDVYQWEQELFDGSTTIFECLRRPNTVVVIPVSGNTVYYSHQEQPNKPPFLGLFGGRAEEGENPLQTAQRELLEETGFTSSSWHLFQKVATPGKIEWNIYYYIAYNCQKTTHSTLDAGEKIEVKSTTIDDFINTIIPHPNFREFELKSRLFSAPNPTESQSLATILANPL